MLAEENLENSKRDRDITEDLRWCEWGRKMKGNKGSQDPFKIIASEAQGIV